MWQGLIVCDLLAPHSLRAGKRAMYGFSYFFNANDRQVYNLNLNSLIVLFFFTAGLDVFDWGRTILITVHSDGELFVTCNTCCIECEYSLASINYVLTKVKFTYLRLKHGMFCAEFQSLLGFYYDETEIVRKSRLIDYADPYYCWWARSFYRAGHYCS